jgi:predicted AAA+ superfamily ATPase
MEASRTVARFASADEPTLRGRDWIEQQWDAARLEAGNAGKRGAALILDEIQKIPNWSETVKRLWDEDTHSGSSLKVVVLGSAPLLISRGLTESLAGRFELLHLPHWSYSEMKSAFAWDLEQYLYYGGYPGSAPLIKDEPRWKRYVLDSLIETTLGQLQDAGNSTTLAHYLDLLAGAGMVGGLQKFAGEPVRQRGSSPKLQVFNTALITAQSGFTRKEATSDHEYWGRVVESALGAHLTNAAAAGECELFYWRDRGVEVDFIVRCGHAVTAIEVKSGRSPNARSGLMAFGAAFKPQRKLLVGGDGITLEAFLSRPVQHWVKRDKGG